MKKVVFAILPVLLAVHLSLAEETSFQRVKVPDLNGRQIKAVLTFSDKNKAVEVRPVKGAQVTIPYDEIDKCSYEFTKKHRITERSVALAPVGGAIVMLTKSKTHWLEIDYHEQDTRKVFVVRMDKHNYVRILEALKTHTGIDAEILGNADKR